MGTGGSRYGAGRPAHRPAAGSYRKLDIRRMVKAGCIKPHNWFGWQWKNDEGEEVASVSCKVNYEANGLTVTYRWKNSYETEWQPVDRHVWLTSTVCNYGGVLPAPCCCAVCHGRGATLYQVRAIVLFVATWRCNGSGVDQTEQAGGQAIKELAEAQAYAPENF